jgi:uncharacterized Zn finger protein
MIKLNENTMQNAINKARSERKNLTVRMTNAARMYRVESKASGNIYTVNFFVRNGSRFGTCTCKAGEQGKHCCKHIAAAAALNACLAANGAFNRQIATSVV